jgi:DNA-3-methyladenine glycosylase II
MLENSGSHVMPHTFELALPGPIDMPASVERFRRWGDDLLDRWDGQTFVRVTYADGVALPYACTVIGTTEAPRGRVMVREPAEAPAVERAIRGMWGMASPGSLEQLAARDPAIARLNERFPGMRPIVHADGFSALVRSISAQQVNLTWAATTRRRLAERLGQRHTIGQYAVYTLAPARLAAAAVSDLRAMQFTTRKAEYLIGLASHMVDGSLDLATLAASDDEEVVARLCTVRGLGRWTAEWYLARTLSRPVVVAGDLGVRKAVGLVYDAGPLPDEGQVRALTAHWGAAAGLAQELVLYALAMHAAAAK